MVHKLPLSIRFKQNEKKRDCVGKTKVLMFKLDVTCNDQCQLKDEQKGETNGLVQRESCRLVVRTCLVQTVVNHNAARSIGLYNNF